MTFFRGIFYRLPRVFARTFRGYSLLLQIIAGALTYLSVTSGFDYVYFVWTRDPILMSFMFPAALIGFFVPVFLPLMLYFYGAAQKNESLKSAGVAVAQAALAGLLLSFFYKAFTGRAHPELFTSTSLTDITREFHFGFMRGGVFWGWPSSHTTTAFSVAAALVALYRKNKVIVYSSIIYALYVGLGVSMTIHWFSDFLGGAIFGSVIGWHAGNNFIEVSSENG